MDERLRATISISSSAHTGGCGLPASSAALCGAATRMEVAVRCSFGLACSDMFLGHATAVRRLPHRASSELWPLFLWRNVLTMGGEGELSALWLSARLVVLLKKVIAMFEALPPNRSVNADAQSRLAAAPRRSLGAGYVRR